MNEWRRIFTEWIVSLLYYSLRVIYNAYYCVSQYYLHHIHIYNNNVNACFTTHNDKIFLALCNIKIIPLQSNEIISRSQWCCFRRHKITNKPSLYSATIPSFSHSYFRRDLSILRIPHIQYSCVADYVIALTFSARYIVCFFRNSCPSEEKQHLLNYHWIST